jgi:enoyl-CoA hydratase/carnithine racemase
MKRDTGTETLLLDVDGGIARVTFNNPAKHNALSVEMREGLRSTLREVRDDPSVRVVVMTGAGDKAFISGADISEFGERRTSADARQSFDRAGEDLGRAWTELVVPVIAMIRGYCIGGGLLTAMQADIRIASRDAQFGVPAARLGLGYGYGGVKQLVDLVGPAWTAEILYSARRLSAEEAERIGLVNRVVDGDRLEEEVASLAAAISANAPLTIAACKAAIAEARRDPDRRNLKRVAEMVEACFRSQDYLEGQRAFLEKRPPRFEGR